MTVSLEIQDNITILGPMRPEFEEILTPSALNFVAFLANKFSARREELLQARIARQAELDLGVLPDFREETRYIREGNWKISPVPADLQDRRVEITGPSGDVKMVINACNSGANTYMTDFEDSQSPTWRETIQGQINLKEAIEGRINYKSPEGKEYSLNQRIATLIVRPRGWHLLEKHVLVDGKPVSASIFDFALFFFHNARTLVEKGSGPYFYLPKMESYLEARLWNEIFTASEEELRLPHGTIKATALIETILAAFEMDEILYELREHSSGLNCGRWDYIFSTIKKFAEDPACLMPDRGQVTMESHFLRSYSLLLIKTCHRREIHAMGGMAAQIPIRDDPAANAAAMDKVRADKRREAGDGHDGTWVAHPGLVGIAKEIFDREMPQPNQIARKRQDVDVAAADLLAVPKGTISEAGLRQNLNVGIGYIEAWLRGSGCVPLYHLMEDAATAEISRAQVWQWIRHKAKLADGRTVDLALCRTILDEELQKLKTTFGDEARAKGRFKDAAQLFLSLIEAPRFPEWLTIPAYERIVREGA